MSRYTVHGVSLPLSEVVSDSDHNDRITAVRIASRLVKDEEGDPNVECTLAYVYDNQTDELVFTATKSQQEYLS